MLLGRFRVPRSRVRSLPTSPAHPSPSKHQLAAFITSLLPPHSFNTRVFLQNILVSSTYWGSLHKWNPAIRVRLQVSIFAQQRASLLHSWPCYVAAAQLLSPMNCNPRTIHRNLRIRSTAVKHSLEATLYSYEEEPPPWGVLLVSEHTRARQPLGYRPRRSVMLNPPTCQSVFHSGCTNL